MTRRLVLSLIMALATASAAQAQVTLQPKFAEGTRIIQSTQKFQQMLNIAGQDVPTTSEATTVVTRTVGQRMPDGTLRIQEKIDRMTLNLELPGNMKLVFDTDKPDAKADLPELQAILDGLKAFRGASYTYILNKDNKAVGVEGLDKILAAIPAGGEEVKSRLSVDTVKGEFNDELAVLPDKAVKPGDKWQRSQTMNIGGGQTLKFDAYFEYQGTVERGGRTLDKIGVFYGTVAYDMDPNSPSPAKVTKSDLKIDSSAGTVFFDREKGQVVETTGNTRLSGPMTFNIMGMELAAKLDLTMETTSRLK